MATIETRIVRLEERFPEADPFDELDHKELKALLAFLDEDLAATEQGRKVSREVLVALEVSGRDWDEWFRRTIKMKYPNEWSAINVKAEGAK